VPCLLRTRRLPHSHNTNLPSCERNSDDLNPAGADQSSIGESNEPEMRLIPLIFQAIKGKRAALEIFGDDYPTRDGTCICDHIHGTDLAQIITTAWNWAKSK
jgi:UDP-glucose 4-epimerase